MPPSYYRLHVVHLVVPPLRDRREDITPLLLHFLKLASTDQGLPVPELTTEAATYLEGYRWPGNVRELKNFAERLVVGYDGKAVRLQDLPAEMMVAEAILEPGAPPAFRQCPIDNCYDRMTTGRESFWTTVYEPFIGHDMTREAVRAIVRRGLEQTHGSYPLVATQFNVPDADYRKFMRFLHKHHCHMPIQSFRMLCDVLPPAPHAAVGVEG